MTGSDPPCKGTSMSLSGFGRRAAIARLPRHGRRAPGRNKGGFMMSIRGTVAVATTVLALAGAAAAPSASADPEPTLGQVWAPSQQGYGTVRPTKVFNGGDPTGMI